MVDTGASFTAISVNILPEPIRSNVGNSIMWALENRQVITPVGGVKVSLCRAKLELGGSPVETEAIILLTGLNHHLLGMKTLRSFGNIVILNMYNGELVVK